MRQPDSDSSPLLPSEPLVLFRCGHWRALLPLQFLERVYPAAMPSLRPSAEPVARPTLSVAGASLPVCFGEALLGAGRVVLRQGDQLLSLRDGERRGLLWVSAAEDVVPYEASFADAAPGDFATAIHGAGGEAVLDVPRLLAALDAGSPARSGP